MSCEPLGTWLWRRKNKGLRFQRMSSACRRGYEAEWEIHKGRLYMSSITGTLSDGSPATFASMFANYSKQYLDSVGANDPANAGPGAFAFWVTGVLSCSFGKLLKYEHAGYASIREGELHLRMKDGFLIGTRIVHRELPIAGPDDELDCDLSFGDEVDIGE